MRPISSERSQGFAAGAALAGQAYNHAACGYGLYYCVLCRGIGESATRF